MISAPLFPETSQTVVIGASSTQSTATAMTSYFVRLNLRHRLLRCRWHQSHGDHQQPAAVAGVAKHPTKRLNGRIEIDDAYLGGERSGGKRGRGAPGKTPFVAAVETTTAGKPVRLKLRRVTSFCATSIAGLPSAASTQTALSSAMALSVSPASQTPGARTRSSRPGQDQKRLDASLQMGQHRAWQHQGRHHRDLPRHQQQACPTLPRRIRIPLQPKIRSGRHDPSPRLGRRRTTPMPYRLLKLAEVYA